MCPQVWETVEHSVTQLWVLLPPQLEQQHRNQRRHLHQTHIPMFKVVSVIEVCLL